MSNFLASSSTICLNLFVVIDCIYKRMQIPSFTKVAPHLGITQIQIVSKCECVWQCPLSFLPLAAVASHLSAVYLFSFGSFFISSVSVHFVVFFASFFLALLKLTTLAVEIAIACPILWHLAQSISLVPGVPVSPEVVSDFFGFSDTTKKRTKNGHRHGYNFKEEKKIHTHTKNKNVFVLFFLCSGEHFHY